MNTDPTGSGSTSLQKRIFKNHLKHIKKIFLVLDPHFHQGLDPFTLDLKSQLKRHMIYIPNCRKSDLPTDILTQKSLESYQVNIIRLCTACPMSSGGSRVVKIREWLSLAISNQAFWLGTFGLGGSFKIFTARLGLSVRISKSISSTYKISIFPGVGIYRGI